MLISTSSLVAGSLLPEKLLAKPESINDTAASILTADPSPDLSQAVNLYDIEQLAKARIGKMAYDFIDSGAADEITVKWNRESFDKIRLKPRVLTDVSKLDTSVDLFGEKLPYPILIAPSAYHRIIHPDGEIATAKGARAAQALYVVSSNTTTPIEEIRESSDGPLWFQLYIWDDREKTKELIFKVIENGVTAICVTVDTPINGSRDRQIKSKFALPSDVHAPYLSDRAMARGGKIPQTLKPLTWKDIEWLKSFTKVPVVLKGILNPDDAELAIQSGASGIIVSNHGGRNLDTLPATAEVMPFIADKVKGRVPLLMDGGIRRGTDVVKALAMGANAVLVGRPPCYGLGAGGADGVTKVMNMLRNELEIAMRLCGKPTLKSIDRSVLF